MPLHSVFFFFFFFFLLPGLGRSPGEGIGYLLQYSWASLEAQMVKNLAAMWETYFRSLGWEDPLGKETATHSRIDGFPRGSDSKESACSVGDSALIPRWGRSPGGGNGNPLQYSGLDNPHRGAWWATIHGVTKSQTRLSD